MKTVRIGLLHNPSLPSSPTGPPTAKQHDLCMRSRDPWKLQKAARGNIWMILMGSGDVGGVRVVEPGESRANWCKLRQMWGICSAGLVMTGSSQRTLLQPQPCVQVAPRCHTPGVSSTQPHIQHIETAQYTH